MIHPRLGQAEPAREYLKRRVQCPRKTRLLWTEQVETEALLREARELLESEPAAEE
jgi:hypothetical protein